MNETAKSTGKDWAICILFFLGVALIAAGLWRIWVPIGLVFLGITCWYVAGCLGNAAKSPERTVTK